MNPVAHLVCFQIRQNPPADGPIVRVKNQFGIGTLDVRAEELLRAVVQADVPPR